MWPKSIDNGYDFAKGKVPIIGRDTELLMDIIRNGWRANKDTYEIAMEIREKFEMKKREPKSLISDEKWNKEIDDMLLIVEEKDESK